MPLPVKIKLASRTYDGTLPILRGQIGIHGFQLDITETDDVPGMFAGMFKGQYDVSEMSLGELILLYLPRQGGFYRCPGFSIAYLSPRLYFLPQVVRYPRAE